MAAGTMLFLSLASQARATGSVTLQWNPNLEPDIAGYRLYYGLASGNYTQQIDVGNTTARTVSNLADGTTYFFAVTAYNTVTMESPLSNEVSATVGVSPTPTPTPSPTPTPTPAPTPTPIPTGGFTNGSFESGYTGWSQSGNQNIYANAQYPTTHGTKGVQFNGGQALPNGVLRQTFLTTVGTVYHVNFDLGVYSYQSNAEERARVMVVGSGTLLSQNISVFGIGTGAAFTPKAFTFTANSSSTTLSFTDISPATQNIDLLLDNVRVTSTAESASPKILWQNGSTGERAVWLMNGTNFSGSVSLGVMATSWNIMGSGDFNGDGKADILWQHTSGARSIWLMDGTVHTSSVSLKPWRHRGTSRVRATSMGTAKRTFSGNILPGRVPSG